jgi:hypothetical protein
LPTKNESRTNQHSLQREVFDIPLVAEYFNPRELTMLTGQPNTHFGAVLEKELADNALDAAEFRWLSARVVLRGGPQ